MSELDDKMKELTERFRSLPVISYGEYETLFKENEKIKADLKELKAHSTLQQMEIDRLTKEMWEQDRLLGKLQKKR